MTRAPNYEDKSLYFPFKLILLSIFYLLSSYHPTNVTLLLDSFSHVAEMPSLLMLRLELQSLKFAEMLSLLMLRLKLQNMKISHYIFVFKFILLSIFYSLLLYPSTNVIILLECHQLIVVVWLKPQII